MASLLTNTPPHQEEEVPMAVIHLYHYHIISPIPFFFFSQSILFFLF